MKIAVATSDQTKRRSLRQSKGFAIYEWDGQDSNPLEFIEYIEY